MHNPQKVTNEVITMRSKGMPYRDIETVINEAGFRTSTGGVYTRAGLSAMVSYRKKRIKKGQKKNTILRKAKKEGFDSDTKQFKSFVKTTMALSISPKNKLSIIESALDGLI